MNKQQGFTFLEAIIAMLVLTIGIVAVLQVFPTAFSLEMANQMETQASFLAQEKMEVITNTTYQSIAIAIDTETPLAVPFEKFSRETTVVYVDADLLDSVSDTGLKKITVRVWWNSPLSIVDDEVILSALVAEK